MAGRHRLMIVVTAGLLASAVEAQKRPYDVVMKDVGSTVASLRKGLSGGDLLVVASGADALAQLFQETEDFWTPFKTKDAIDAAKGARDLARTIASAAKSNDLQKAQASAAGLGRYCTTCHDSHREQLPDKSYRIKP